MLSPHPTYANRALATSYAIQLERQRQGKPLLDVWFEFEEDNVKYYITERSDGSGEYLRKLPPTVPPSKIVRIALPITATAAFELLDQLDGLIKRFQETSRFIDEPTGEELELEGGKETRPPLEELLSLICNIRLATDPAYDEQMTATLVGQLNDAARSYVASTKFPELERAVSGARKTAEAMRGSLLCDSWVASFFLVFHDLCASIFQEGKESGTRITRLQTDYLGRVTDLSSASKQHPLHLLGFVTARALRSGALETVVRLANEYLEEGRDLVEEGMKAPTRHLHGDALYRAAVVLFAARELFRDLLNSAPLLPGANVEKLKDLSTGSAEELVKVQDALLFALRNRGDELLDAQRDALQKLGQKKGQNRLEAEITGTIEQRYYYPRVFRAFLRGGPRPLEE